MLLKKRSQAVSLGLLICVAIIHGSQIYAGRIQNQQQPVPQPSPKPSVPSVVSPQVASSPPVPAVGPIRQTLPATTPTGIELPYRVLVPNDYQKSDRRYAVLYLLHGLTGNENDWLERSRLVEYAAKYKLIIVTPGVGDTWYANSASNPKARYEDVIVRDLIPYIDANYRTIGTRDGRAIAGLSMGGLAAIKFALRYPELFAFAGSLSGAFDVPRTARLGKSPSAKMLKDLRSIYGDEKSQVRRENDVFWLLDQVTAKTTLPYLYVSTGKKDPLPQVFESNPRFAEALRAKKLNFEYNERAGSHDWHFWDSEINLMLGKMCVFMKVICS